jgi:hypothetical protein
MRGTCSTSCKSSRMYSTVCNFASARIMPLNKLVASATTSRSKWHMRRTRARTATASLGRARRSQILLGAAAPARQGRPRKVQVCKPLLQAVPRRRQDQTDHEYLKHAVRLVDANMFSLVRELVWYRPASSPEHKKKTAVNGERQVQENRVARSMVSRDRNHTDTEQRITRTCNEPW